MNSPSAVTKSPWLRSVPLLLGLFVVIALTSWGCLLIDDSKGSGGEAALWWSNAILLSALLLTPRRKWLSLFLVGYFANVAAHMLLHYSPMLLNFGLPLCDMLEVGLTVAVFSRDASGATSFSRFKELIRLYLAGALVAPALSSLCGFAIMRLAHVPAAFDFAIYWFASNGLATVALAPIILALFDKETYAIFRRPQLLQTFGLLLLMTVCSVLILGQSSYPLLFLLCPPLLLIVVRLGLGGGVLGVLIITGFSTYFALHERGPLRLIKGIHWQKQLFFAQILVASMVLCVALVAVVLNERKVLEEAARKSERLYRLLAENSRDIIVLTDLDHKREYVSPAVQWTMGWDPQELVGSTFEQSIVHPDDIGAMRRTLEALKNGEPAKTLTYRCQKKDGTYIWMEAHISLYCDRISGTPIGYVNVVRNVAERKAAEERLHDAYSALETLATIDGLTGVANRRHFDEVITQEWRRAARVGRPVSLLLLDVDQFKSYNDLYGHLRGDSCLRQVAESALDIIQRPSDLVARFGGEEFGVILPETDSSSALELAEKIRVSVESRVLDHRGNTPGIVTVSIGCATIVPERGSSANILIDTADHALYDAKRAGRNKVIVASGPFQDPLPGTESRLPL